MLLAKVRCAKVVGVCGVYNPSPGHFPKGRGAPSREWHTLKKKEDFMTFTF